MSYQSYAPYRRGKTTTIRLGVEMVAYPFLYSSAGSSICRAGRADNHLYMTCKIVRIATAINIRCGRCTFCRWTAGIGNRGRAPTSDRR